ncbi:MAG: ubiquinone/menaquinone biosynthesis methyltransferase [Acidimicrobiaceae bacterium]|nr:ubiquinone/menaquinone biosynthesis methyltransferase [Acidimicrobiaceae bacterium]MBO0747723.1 ubiquinone/menaquinone biosynthesis methyltransferase [Acidimicrobiaceae bacterium]
MFDTIAPRYDLVNRVMTIGLDRRWRQATVRALNLMPGDRVLDVACGTGDLCRDLAAAGYEAVGIDLSAGMLRHARTGAPLVQGDALELPFPRRALDGAVSGFALRNVADLPSLFAEIARTVRPGGRISLLDVAEPEQRVLRTGHSWYFGHVVPRLGGLLSDPAAYRYLPRSMAYLPSPAAMVEQLRRAGFYAVERRLLSGGITQLLTATRVPA